MQQKTLCIKLYANVFPWGWSGLMANQIRVVPESVAPGGIPAGHKRFHEQPPSHVSQPGSRHDLTASQAQGETLLARDLPSEVSSFTSRKI